MILLSPNSTIALNSSSKKSISFSLCFSHIDFVLIPYCSESMHLFLLYGTLYCPLCVHYFPTFFHFLPKFHFQLPYLNQNDFLTHLKLSLASPISFLFLFSMHFTTYYIPFSLFIGLNHKKYKQL